jgi:hypothetical protein
VPVIWHNPRYSHVERRAADRSANIGSKAETIITMTLVLATQNTLQLLISGDADSVLAGVSDADQLSRPSRVYFATAIKNGILPLGPQNRILPASEVTRADAAVLLDRMQRKFDIPRVQP